jgi:hypothetical protein
VPPQRRSKADRLSILLVRSGKSRHTSSEVSAEKFCDAEFQSPNSGGLIRVLSAYQIDAPQLVQCHTEHYAGAGLDPQGRPDFDLEGLAIDVVAEPLDEWPFRMTAQAHCNIRFGSDGEVQRMAELLLASLAARTHEVTKPEIRTYLRARVADADAEWVAFLNGPGVKATWRTLAGL